nr:hypothetical protein [Tanacetum cinerariifolium]
MFDRTDYDSWSQRIRLYYRGKENGIYILRSIDHGPFELRTTRDTLGTTSEGGVLLRPERPHTYDDFTDNEKKRFDADLKSKFMNNMSPEWDRFMTAVKLNKGLKETNHEQLYAYLKQQEKHAAQDRLIIERITPTANDQLAFVSSVQPYTQSSLVQSHQYPPSLAPLQSPHVQSLPYLHFPESSQLDSGYTQADEILNTLTKQPKHQQNFDYFKDKMLLMQAQENGAVLDEEELLFLTGEQTNNFDTYVDDHPVIDLQVGLSNASILSEVYGLENAIDPYDDNPDEHEIHNEHDYVSYVPREPLVTELNIYKEQVPIYEQRARFELTLREQKMDEQMSILIQDRNQKEENLKKELHSAKRAQPALYDGNELLMPHHVPVLVTSYKEDLELAETTRIKMNNHVCVEKRVKITPHNYSKENCMATFTPQTQLTPEQVFWSKEINDKKANDLKARTAPLPVLPLATMYPLNTPVHLVPRTLPTTSQVNIEVRAMKTVFENLEAEVDQNAINLKSALQERLQNFKAKNEKVKLHYQELFNSIKITLVQTIDKTTSLQNKIENLKTQLKGKMPCVTSNDATPKVPACAKYAIDVQPIPLRQRNSRVVHHGYLNRLRDTLYTLHEIVKEARSKRPSDNNLDYACVYTKRSQELLENVRASCTKADNK